MPKVPNICSILAIMSSREVNISKKIVKDNIEYFAGGRRELEIARFLNLKKRLRLVVYVALT